MIAKAREADPEGDYVEAMLPDWKPSEAVDLIHTMECLYWMTPSVSFTCFMTTGFDRVAGWLSALTITKRMPQATIGDLHSTSTWLCFPLQNGQRG